MIDALYISASGLRSEQKQIDVISNNVANMQTPGFKRSRVNFVEVAGGATPATESQPAWEAHGNGTRIASTSMSFAPGEIRMTSNPLDLAIDGDGFFELAGADGNMVYTRAGQFHVDTEGNLVSVRGLPLAHGIQIPAGASGLQISPTGELTAVLAGDTERSSIGTIELTSFSAPDALTAIGDNGFAANDATGAPSYGKAGDAGFGKLQQGALELANVEMIDEMSALVMAQRAYQLNARVLQASDQVLETINNLRR
jgi:flagellar basal-body rod protein FlgG